MGVLWILYSCTDHYWNGSGSSKKWPKKLAKARRYQPDTDPFALEDYEQSKHKKRQDLETSFISRETTVRQSSIGIPAPRRNTDVKEDYTEVFLCHARIYNFAQKYFIEPLRQLALDELHQVLAIFTLHKERTGDIITLLKYVYSGEHSGESRDGVEDLKTLMTHYMGFQMDTLLEDDDFHALLDGSGDLLKDFLRMVAKRI